MKGMRLFIASALAIAFSIVLTLAAPALAGSKQPSALEKAQNFVEHGAGQEFTIYGPNGKILSQLSHEVTTGDYLITQDNKGWKISRVSSKKAYAKFDKVVDLNEKTDPGDRITLGSAVFNLWDKMKGAVGFSKKPNQTLAIYHTHSDESYQPTRGVANEQRGDIYKVGDSLASALRAKGFRVIHSMNNHNPHDAAAYTRSRRTVAELMKYQPAAMIDVHRDAIPNAGYYQRQVSGQEIAATRLVIGKQNANRSVNFDFAKNIKAKADKEHPGLVREIFWGHGNYNQDVGPKMILIEFGTHTNPEGLADAGAKQIADILPLAIFGTATATGRGPAIGTNRGWTGLLWVLGVALALGIGFLVLNKGGFELFKNTRGSGNTGSTAAGFLGNLEQRRRKKRQNPQKKTDGNDKP